MAIYAHVDGFCPACGQFSLMVRNGERVVADDDRQVRCQNRDCPDSHAAHKILQDPEVHHIVRFDDQGWFNVKHPLRERVDSELLDCSIHDVVVDAIEMDLVVPEGLWRLIGHPSVYIPGGPDQEADWEWEQL